MAKHLLTGEELTPTDIHALLQMALILKKERGQQPLHPPLAGQHLALIFDKPSLRTRFSFMVAMRELGGDVIESVDSTRKTETPADQAKVLAGYCHGIMIRTHADSILQEMATVSTIPLINGLSDQHHPCQILADLLTLLEVFGALQNLTLCYVGDGNNILHSLLLLAPQLGINIHYSCPAGREPHPDIVARAKAKVGANIHRFATAIDAVKGAHAVYTDVWASMGFETGRADHLFAEFQVNEALMAHAQTDAIFMHCLPMERGKEVSTTLPDKPCSVIFQQSENRLHVQKAILLNQLT